MSRYILGRHRDCGGLVTEETWYEPHGEPMSEIECSNPDCPSIEDDEFYPGTEKFKREVNKNVFENHLASLLAETDELGYFMDIEFDEIDTEDIKEYMKGHVDRIRDLANKIYDCEKERMLK